MEGDGSRFLVGVLLSFQRQTGREHHWHFLGYLYWLAEVFIMMFASFWMFYWCFHLWTFLERCLRNFKEISVVFPSKFYFYRLTVLPVLRICASIHLSTHQDILVFLNGFQSKIQKSAPCALGIQHVYNYLAFRICLGFASVNSYPINIQISSVHLLKFSD